MSNPLYVCVKNTPKRSQKAYFLSVNIGMSEYLS